jgi:hypothetical protein
MNYKNILMITDADGTLLTDDKRILDRDKTAIADFIAGGGGFTIATGRGVTLARTVVRELGLDLISLPCVIFNGAAVYDYKTEEFLWQCNLCESGKRYFEKLLDNFPNIGVEILVGDKIYVTNTNDFEEAHLKLGNITPVRCDYGEVPKSGWIKVLLVDEPRNIDKLIEFVDKNPCKDVHVVRSAPMYFEILPYGVNKGTGIQKLLELIGLKDRYIVAAGDYMNDLEMIKQADLGVATGNAEQIVKASADAVVCDNNSGIIKEILYELERIANRGV